MTLPTLADVVARLNALQRADLVYIVDRVDGEPRIELTELGRWWVAAAGCLPDVVAHER